MSNCPIALSAVAIEEYLGGVNVAHMVQLGYLNVNMTKWE